MRSVTKALPLGATFDVVGESLRHDIRIIAEGLIALDVKVETIRDSG